MTLVSLRFSDAMVRWKRRHVSQSHIRVDTKVRLYRVYVLMYDSEAWTVRRTLDSYGHVMVSL